MLKFVQLCLGLQHVHGKVGGVEVGWAGEVARLASGRSSVNLVH